MRRHNNYSNSEDDIRILSSEENNEETDNLNVRIRFNSEQFHQRQITTPSTLALNNEEIIALVSRKPEVQPDRYNLVYWTFYLVGVSTLLPWNFFISVTSFWDYKFRNTTISGDGGGNSTSYSSDDDTKTELQLIFTSYLAIASMIPNSIFVILNALFGQRYQLKKRLFGSLGGTIVIFSLFLLLSVINSDSWQRPFLVLVLALVAIINAFTAVFQGGLFGVAGMFPPSYIGGMMAGQAMGGIFPSIVDILAISLKVSPSSVGFSCFFIATGFLIFSFTAFAKIWTSPFFEFYAKSAVSQTGSLSNSNESLLGNQEDEEDDIEIIRENHHHQTSVKETLRSVLLAAKKSWHYCLACFLTFATSLSVFPAVLVLVRSQYTGESPAGVAWAKTYFTPVTCFLLFNVGDYLGRSLSTLASKRDWFAPISGDGVLGRNLAVTFSALRAGFIPIFIFCNAAPKKRILPVVFKSDFVYICMVASFAISNGYLGNLCMIHGPKTASDAREQEEIAMILVACLVLGTAVGSLLSFPLIEML